MVDLFGHEGPPTLEEVQNRMKSEMELLSQAQRYCQHEKAMGRSLLAEVSNTDLEAACLESVKIISHRLKDLREMRVRKVLSLEKWQSLADAVQGSNAKYEYIISAMKTTISQIDSSIQQSLISVDYLLNSVSVLRKDHNYVIGVNSFVDLGRQANHVCLAQAEGQTESRYTKQRTEYWSELRKQAKVTGI